MVSLLSSGDNYILLIVKKLSEISTLTMTTSNSSVYCTVMNGDDDAIKIATPPPSCTTLSLLIGGK